uniref:Uncharacterized protein n=1 Tax=Biomphalaria glabrata TaxID=6526 RepID=A0A2C9LW91_BIOGL
MCCTLNVRQDGQVKDVTIQGHEAHLFLIASMASGDKILIPQSYKCRMRRLGACSACVQADTKVTSCVMFSKAYVILYSPLIEPRLSDTSCRCPKTSGWRTRTLCDNSNTSCRQLDICNKMSHTLCRKLHSAQEYWDVSSEKCRIPDMTSLSISSTRKIRETDFNFSCDLCTLVLAFIMLKPCPYVIYLKISLNHCILSQIERCFPLIHLCQPTNALYKPILTRTPPRLMDECKKATSHQLTNNVHQFEHASLGMQNSCMSSALTQRTSTMAPRVAAHHQHSATCPCTNNTLQAKGLSNKHNAVDARALTSLEKCNKELKHCRKARKRNSQLSIVPNTPSPPRAQLFSPLQFVIILCSIISVGFTAVSSQRVIGTFLMYTL